MTLFPPGKPADWRLLQPEPPDDLKDVATICGILSRMTKRIDAKHGSRSAVALKAERLLGAAQQLARMLRSKHGGQNHEPTSESKPDPGGVS